MSRSRFVALFLIITAFVLIFMVTLSTPVTKSIYLVKLVEKDGGGTLHAGVWGYCVSGLHESVLGIEDSTKNGCSNSKLGYNILTDGLGLDGALGKVTKTLSYVLVLHPILVALSFLALVPALFSVRPTKAKEGDNSTKGDHSVSMGIAAAMSLMAAPLATTVFIIDIVLVAIVRDKVHDATDNVDPQWGNAIWMSLGAALALWLSIAFSGYGICRGAHWEVRTSWGFKASSEDSNDF